MTTKDSRWHYEKTTFVILNYLLLSFGLKLKSDHQLVFALRSIDYVPDRKTADYWVEIIPIASELSQVFELVDLNYDAYEVGFSNIFEYSDFLNSSSYLTPSMLRAMEKQLDKPDLIVDTEVRNELTKVISHIKMTQTEHDNRSSKPLSSPFFFHSNLKEKVVRRYFKDNAFDDRIREIKRRKLTFLAHGKISKGKILEWFPLFKEYPELHDMFMLPFINYMTENTPNKFPGYLADSEVAEIRRDMRDFYTDIFIHDVMQYLHGGVEDEA